MILVDSIRNLLSSLGTAADKAMHTQWRFTLLDKQQLDAAYRGDWVARKAIDIPSYDATREWRSWQAEKDAIELIEAVERTHHVQLKVRRAMTKGDLYGGGALVIGVDVGASEEELKLEALRQGSLKYLHVVHRYNLNAGPVVKDINNPWFGEPQYYDIGRNVENVTAGTRLHPSRVIRFIGNSLPDESESIDGWGDPVLFAIDEAIKQMATVHASVATLIQEAKNDVIKIPGLSQRASNAEYKRTLLDRFTVSNSAKSVINATLLDEKESIERLTANFAGLPDIMKLYMIVVSAARDIPATRFLSQSPAGLNATGDSDIRNYYDHIGSMQKVDIAAALARLDEVIIRSALGERDNGIFYTWNPLWQMTPKEKADTDKVYADIFKVDVDAGLVDQEALRKGRENQLIESGIYPGLDQALEEAEALRQQQERAAAREQSSPEPTPSAEEEASGGGGVPSEVATGRRNDPPALDGRTFGDYAKNVIRRLVKDATPRTLYVRRNVLNAREIISWAKGQGFETTVPADQLHVTIAYSRTPVDWLKMGEPWGCDDNNGELIVPPGGPRIVEPLGPNGAIVLMFASSRLSWRNEDIRMRGASWDWDEYTPHITITWNAPDMIASGRWKEIVPYQGEIRLGQEIFEEINEDFRAGIRETPATRDALPSPVIDMSKLVDALANRPPPVVNVHMKGGKVVKTVDHDDSGRVTRITEEEVE